MKKNETDWKDTSKPAKPKPRKRKPRQRAEYARKRSDQFYYPTNPYREEKYTLDVSREPDSTGLTVVVNVCGRNYTIAQVSDVESEAAARKLLEVIDQIRTHGFYEGQEYARRQLKELVEGELPELPSYGDSDWSNWLFGNPRCTATRSI